MNEILIGVANFDVVKELISNSLRSQMKVPLDSSLEMLLLQKSLYPILPNLVNSDDIEKMDKIITVDNRKLSKFSFEMPPDVVITSSSSMNHYIKKSHSTLFINPGTLIKNGKPGSILKITSYPYEVKYNLIFKNGKSNDIISRLKVDIIKLSFK